MTSLRKPNDISTLCQQQNQIHKQNRQERREMILANNRIKLIIQSETEEQTHRSQTPPHEYLSKYTRMKQQIEMIKTRSVEMIEILNRIFSDSIKSKNPPVISMYQSGVIKILFERYEEMTIEEKELFLSILSNITSDNYSTTKELLDYNIISILFELLNRNQLINEVCRVLNNLCIDSFDILNSIVQQGLIDQLITILKSNPSIPHSVMWLIQCIISHIDDIESLHHHSSQTCHCTNSSSCCSKFLSQNSLNNLNDVNRMQIQQFNQNEIEPKMEIIETNQMISKHCIYQAFLPLVIQLCQKEQNATKIQSFVILNTIVTNSIETITSEMMKEILHSIYNSCERNDCSVTASLRVLNTLTTSLYCKEFETIIIQILQLQHISKSLTAQRILYKCINNILLISETFSQYFIETNSIGTFLNIILTHSDETIKSELMLCVMKILQKNTYLYQSFSIDNWNMIVNAITRIPITLDNTVIICLDYLHKLLDVHIPLIDLDLNNLEYWFDKLNSSRNMAVKQLASIIYKEYFNTFE